MRRAAFVLGPFTLLAATVFACENDSGGAAGPTLQLDGSVAPFDGSQPFDGSLPPTPDTGLLDGPAPVRVTITVTTAKGDPEANVRVVFHDATGAVMETKVTGADGKASSTGDILPAMASALLASGSSRNIVTWTGLENGDDLAVRDVDSSGDFVGQLNVAMPGPFSNDGMFNYEVVAGGCGSSTQETSLALTLYSSCVGVQPAVVARATQDGMTVGHSFKKATAVPTDGGAFDVATGAWKPRSNVTVTATNLPVDSYAAASLLDIADGRGYSNDGYETSFDGDTVTLASADGFADALQANVRINPQTLGSIQAIAKRVPVGTSITIDAAQALPPITDATLSGSDARRPIVEWTSTSTAAADGGLIRMWYRGPEDANFYWTFVVPPGSTKVTAPAMPPEAESFMPEAGDAGPTAFDDPEVAFIEADTLPGYALFRRQQGVLVGLDTSIGGFTFPAMPVNGTYRATAYRLTR